ncbi:MAG: hypothetical protein EPN73_23975 [Paraburkholderia sp.]|uniref:hypothetical protein n=1 Tax=Paraburkholderia sp. TaxID=1926495 RepID=UPI00122A7C6E|nr:hypothetical protein [Paraburkholderia sp.]TAL92720.1 MAG: hypothetical protein EPN73_23975 [Paraburkholderia sp.]
MTSETRLIGREVIASDTMAFHFDAGQAIDLILPDSVAAEAHSARHTSATDRVPVPCAVRGPGGRDAHGINCLRVHMKAGAIAVEPLLERPRSMTP